jgi:hypothetical protein
MTAIIGITCDPGRLSAESEKWLKKPWPPMSQSYLNAGQSWQAGMWSGWFETEVVHCTEQVMLTVPMLVGAGWQRVSGQPFTPGQALSPQNPSGANVPTVMRMQDVAAGMWDGMYRPAAASIARTCPNARIRLGWENYGPWYAWGGKAQEELFIAEWDHLTDLFLEESPDFTFDWNGCRSANIGTYDPRVNGFPTKNVHSVSLDFYNIDAFPGLKGWNGNYQNSKLVLESAAAFAKAKGLPLGIPEWGLDVADDEVWAMSVWEWIVSTPGVGYALYYDRGPAAFANCPKTAAAVVPLMAKAV